MAEELLMEDGTQDRNTGQMAAISADTQAQPAKPPTLNGLIVERMTSIEGTIAFLADIVQMKNLVITALILGCFNLAGMVICLVCFGFLFGRFVP